MHECLQRKLGCLLCAICQSFHRCWIWSAIFPVCDLSIKELLPAQYFEGSMVSPHKSNPLVLQKILARIDYAIRNKNIAIVYFFMLSSCDVAALKAGRRRVALACKVFLLNSNDVMDAVLSTDLGEQRCFKFLTRQLVSLNKTKIISSVVHRKPLPVVSVVGRPHLWLVTTQ